MRSDTQSVTVAAPPEKVFELVADPQNLPRWAVVFAQGVRREGDRWIVTSPQGEEVPLTVDVDRAHGVVDFVMEPAPGAQAVAHSRVLPNGDGAEYVFTQFQFPGMADEVFESMVTSLGHEFTALKGLFE